MENLFTGDLFGIIAPILIMINAVLMLAAEIISDRAAKAEEDKKHETPEKTEFEEIKERWKRVS